MSRTGYLVSGADFLSCLRLSVMLDCWETSHDSSRFEEAGTPRASPSCLRSRQYGEAKVSTSAVAYTSTTSGNGKGKGKV